MEMAVKTGGKNKPDYTKFMKKPAPLQMSAPPDGHDRGPVREDSIPWAEIIEVVPPREASVPQEPHSEVPYAEPAPGASPVWHHPEAEPGEQARPASYGPAARLVQILYSESAPPLPVLFVGIAILMLIFYQQLD